MLGPFHLGGPKAHSPKDFLNVHLLLGFGIDVCIKKQMKIAALEKMFMKRRGEKDSDMKLFLGQGFQYLIWTIGR